MNLASQCLPTEPHRHGTMTHTSSANHYHIHQTSKNRDGPLIYVKNLLDMLYVVYEGLFRVQLGMWLVTTQKLDL